MWREYVAFTPATPTYTLKLSPRYAQRRTHPRFHAGQVKKWLATDEDRCPNRLFNPKPLFPVDGVTMNSLDDGLHSMVPNHGNQEDQGMDINKVDRITTDLSTVV